MRAGPQPAFVAKFGTTRISTGALQQSQEPTRAKSCREGKGTGIASSIGELKGTCTSELADRDTPSTIAWRAGICESGMGFPGLADDGAFITSSTIFFSA